MKIVVVGGGKIGYYLCRTLIEHGHDPVLIEHDSSTATRLADELDIPVVWGDGTLMEPLCTAGIETADALVAVTGDDEKNLVACQLAKMNFGIKRTVAKANDPKNADIMRTLGIDTTISATANIAKLIEQEVDLAGVKQLLPLNRGESGIFEFTLPDDYCYDGKYLIDLRLPEESVITAIQRGGECIIPRGRTAIRSGDRLLIMAKNDILYKVREKLKLD